MTESTELPRACKLRDPKRANDLLRTSNFPSEDVDVVLIFAGRDGPLEVAEELAEHQGKKESFAEKSLRKTGLTS